MKRYLAAPLLVATLLMSGCFTSIGALHGSNKKLADGSTDAGAVVGYALIGALADAAALCAIAALSFSDWQTDEDGIVSRSANANAPAPSPLSIVH